MEENWLTNEDPFLTLILTCKILSDTQGNCSTFLH